MRLQSLAAPIVLVLVSAFCLTPPGASRSEADEQTASAKPCPPLSLDEAGISLAPPAPKDAREKALREARSLRYAGPAATLDPPLEDTPCGVVMVFAHQMPQPLLPTSLSDAVVVGRVSSLQAYLTSERTLLYTEFKVVIDEVVKRPRDAPLAPGQCILVERLGGAIRLRSGKLIAVRPQNFGPLVVGHKYLLFLRRNSEEDHSILGAHDLTKVPIEPLVAEPRPPRTHSGPHRCGLLAEGDSLNPAKLASTAAPRSSGAGSEWAVSKRPGSPPQPSAGGVTSGGRQGRWPLRVSTSPT